MEIRIGVQDVAREVVVESELSGQDVRKLVEEAVSAGTTLGLTDEHGHTVLIPGNKIGYVDIGAEARGRVGFGG